MSVPPKHPSSPGAPAPAAEPAAAQPTVSQSGSSVTIEFQFEEVLRMLLKNPRHKFGNDACNGCHSCSHRPF